MKPLIQKINQKFIAGNAPAFGLIPNNLSESKEISEFTDSLLNELFNKGVIIKVNESFYKGKLGQFKGKYAIFNEDVVQRAFTLNEIQEIYCSNKKISLQEVIRKEDDGYHVRSKKGKNLGGPYDSKEQAKKRLKQVEYFKHVKEQTDLILRERLKDKFFKLEEEIVNKDNKGKLTSSRQASRDKIERGLKDVKVVKGPPGRMDTPEEARYRLATFIELNKKKNKD